MDSINRLNQAISYIENNLCDDIDYDEIGRITLSSITAFQRFFTLTTGIGVAEYIRHRKLTCAALDLRNLDCRIIDIAVKYGYESADAFSIAFKRLFDITPSAYKQSDIILEQFHRLHFELSIKNVMEGVRLIKILDKIVYEPQDCEIGFASCFAAMYMKAEHISQPEYEPYRAFCSRYNQRCTKCGDCPGHIIRAAPSLHELFATVSGIVFALPDLQKSNYLKYGIETGYTRVVEEYDDYVDFLCRFIGYSYFTMEKAVGKTYIFDKIKETINCDRAAILQFEEFENWIVIVGYDDENQTVFGYHQGEAYNYNSGYVKNIRIDDWFDRMRRIVFLEEKVNRKINRSEMFARLFGIMKTGYDTHSLKSNIEYILDDSKFVNVDIESLVKEHSKLINLFFGMVITRCIMSWFFENPYNLDGMDWSRYIDKELNDISIACGNIHDLGHISNGSILGNRYDVGLTEIPNQNKEMIKIVAEKLRSRTSRSVLATVLELTYTQNERIMGALKKIIEKQKMQEALQNEKNN